jgi:hypothetical protein
MPLCLSAEVLCRVLHNRHMSDHHHTDSVLTHYVAVESHCSEHMNELPKTQSCINLLGICCVKFSDVLNYFPNIDIIKMCT